jgi:hypothetical protein
VPSLVYRSNHRVADYVDDPFVHKFASRSGLPFSIIAEHCIIFLTIEWEHEIAYVFQGRKTYIGVAFLAIFFTEIGLIIARVQSSWHHVEFTVGCLQKFIPDTKVFIGCACIPQTYIRRSVLTSPLPYKNSLGAFLSQFAVFVSIIARNVSEPPREWRREEVMFIIKRDGILAFIGVVGENPMPENVETKTVHSLTDLRIRRPHHGHYSHLSNIVALGVFKYSGGYNLLVRVTSCREGFFVYLYSNRF